MRHPGRDKVILDATQHAGLSEVNRKSKSARLFRRRPMAVRRTVVGCIGRGARRPGVVPRIGGGTAGDIRRTGR
jgi:hypothetical protein